MLRTRTFALLPIALLLACCASTPEPTPDPVAPTGPMACAPTFDGSNALAVVSAWSEGSTVHLCLGPPWPDDAESAAGTACMAFDATRGTYTQEVRATPPATPTLPRVEVADNVVRVCPRLDDADCRAVPIANVPAEAPIEAGDVSVNPRGDRLVVAVGAQELEERYAQVYDLDTTEQVARFKISEGSYLCQSPQWLGERLFIHANVCAGPGGVSWAVDPADGTHRFTVGANGAEINTYGAQPVHARGEVWGFLDAFAAEVVLQDVKTGESVAAVSLKGYFPKYTSPSSENTTALVPFGDGDLAVVLSDEAAGVVVILDGATGKILKEGRPTGCSR